MKLKDSMKLKVFESSISEEGKEELLMMIESAESVDDIDTINEVFEEKAKEVRYQDAKAFALNENIIANFKKSEYAEDFKECINLLEDYNKKAINLIKSGEDPNSQKFTDAWDEYVDRINEAYNKLDMKVKMELVKISASSNPNPDEVKAVKDKIDASMKFKGKVFDAAKEIKTNITNAAKEFAGIYS